MNLKKYIQDIIKICRIADFSKKQLLLIFIGMTLLSLAASLFDVMGVTMFFPALFQGRAGESNLFEMVPVLGQLVDFRTLSLSGIFAIVAVMFGAKIMLELSVLLLRDNLTRILRGRLQSEFTANVLSRPMLAIEQLRVGEVSNRVIVDAARTASYVGQGTLLGSKAIQAFGYMLALVFISPYIFIGFVAAGAVLGFLLKRFYHWIAEIGQKVNRVRDHSNRLMVERLNQIRLVKSLGAEREEIIELDKRYNKLSQLFFHRSVLTSISRMFVHSIFFFGALAVALVSLFDTALISSMIFVLAPIFVIIQRMISILNEFNMTFVKIKTDEPSVELFFRDYVYDASKGKTSVTRPLKRIEKIFLDKVSFSYNSDPVLKDLNFSIAPGQAVIIRGASGSGKTTLANLLRDIIQPTSGNILYNDLLIKEIKASALREQIGYVTQESFIFHGTLKENLLYGNRRKISDIQIFEVLDFCGIKDFVHALPDGLGYQVTERGSVLSGGQKQRLNLARTLLRDPSFIILDEITNNLDMDSKIRIVETVRRLSSDRICFIISHDPTMDFEGLKKYELKNGALVQL